MSFDSYRRCTAEDAVRTLAARLVTTALVLLVVPAAARSDRNALTLEVAGAVAGTRCDPTSGSGAPVNGTLGGAAWRIRYGLSNRLAVQAGAFWNRTATFVNTGVGAI